MKLGTNSRYLLELLAAFGLEVMEGICTLPSLHRATTCSSDRTFQSTARLLEKKRLIQLENAEVRSKWVATLTSEGRSAIDGKLDPASCWNEDWDGNWRLFSFDLPSVSTAPRQALRKWLKSHRFGGLQGSVWITPREIGDWTSELAKLNVEASAVVHMAAPLRPHADQTVYCETAWNFDTINRAYRSYLDFLSARPPEFERPAAFPGWFQREVQLWRAAFNDDPLLPKTLWPPSFKTSYLGPEAHDARRRAYRSWRPALFPSLAAAAQV